MANQKQEQTYQKIEATSYSRHRSIFRGRNLRSLTLSILEIVVGIVVFIALWQLAYVLKIKPAFLLPSPLTVWERLVELTESNALGLALTATLRRLVIGFSITIVLGIAIGLIMVNFRRFGRIMSSFSVGLQSFPSIAWVPFAILFVGLNDSGIIFVIVISSVFSMMISTYGGVRNIPSIYIKAAKNMGLGRFTLFRRVMLPAAMPSLVTGVKQAWSFSWHALIGAEILMASVGLGAILSTGADFIRMDQIIAAMIVIFVIGLVVDKVLFSTIEERVRVKRGLNQLSL